MKREIKFRVWHNSLQEMLYDFTLPQAGYGRSLNKAFSMLCMPIMQFTGLKDKNGKDIYEGDIISRLRHKDMKNLASQMVHKPEFARIVKFEQGMFCGDDNSCPLKNDVKYNSDVMDDYEIIGNIYENPELLK